MKNRIVWSEVLGNPEKAMQVVSESKCQTLREFIAYVQSGDLENPGNWSEEYKKDFGRYMAMACWQDAQGESK